MQEKERIDINNQGQIPDGLKMIIKIKNVNNPQEVLKKAKEVMKSVAQFAHTNNWPKDSEWKSILPKWFVESMTNKTLDEIMSQDGQWHFESWIESMYHRAWEWYSSKIEGNTIIIVLNLLSVPYVFEQFLYIFYSQGISMKNMTSEDDLYGSTQH
ncbi:hypothetical protein ABXT08_01755 [Chryseobacterium sp. NRRL B-14859]|uniref:hypothetical protein n=1 Tax=Chryseobacterium sp. NRRL B-14859 TaxID=1562763 RepID=UPI00339792C8